MSVFKNKKVTTVIELSDETKQALAQLDNDMQALVALMKEVTSNQERVLARLAGEIITAEPVGVRVSEEDIVSAQRASPFTRRPRHEQVTWLQKTVLNDGEWHCHLEIAKHYATDTRHLRYLKSSIQGRLREMHEEGLVERRDSEVKGAMYDYRLAKK